MAVVLLNMTKLVSKILLTKETKISKEELFLAAKIGQVDWFWQGTDFLLQAIISGHTWLWVNSFYRLCASSDA